MLDLSPYPPYLSTDHHLNPCWSSFNHLTIPREEPHPWASCRHPNDVHSWQLPWWSRWTWLVICPCRPYQKRQCFSYTCWLTRFSRCFNCIYNDGDNIILELMLSPFQPPLHLGGPFMDGLATGSLQGMTRLHLHRPWSPAHHGLHLSRLKHFITTCVPVLTAMFLLSLELKWPNSSSLTSTLQYQPHRRILPMKCMIFTSDSDEINCRWKKWNHNNSLVGISPQEFLEDPNKWNKWVLIH